MLYSILMATIPRTEFQTYGKVKICVFDPMGSQGVIQFGQKFKKYVSLWPKSVNDPKNLFIIKFYSNLCSLMARLDVMMS